MPSSPPPTSLDSFNTRQRLDAGGTSYSFYSLTALESWAGLDALRLPYALKILLENLLRHEDGINVTADDIASLGAWTPGASGNGSTAAREILFMPARVLMQDFTGVPAVVDLAAMRDAMIAMGGDPALIDPQIPVELVIDHSVIVEQSGTAGAFGFNAATELERNRERYTLLKWARSAFPNFRVVPPDTGICHQVNLEHLARVVFTDESGLAYPDTLVGTDSHTTMINGLGVLGWGVGGIEAEAAMLGQPLPMLVPPVVGLKLTGSLSEGTTATDLVLHITELLRRHGVVGKFVELHGPGIGAIPLETRATIGNMSPEYGATCAIFPVDDETLRYLELTGRPPELIALVEAYTKEQGLFYDPGVEVAYAEEVELDLGSVEPSIAGPSRPQDRIPLSGAKKALHTALAASPAPKAGASGASGAASSTRSRAAGVRSGDVVIAAITSCTNTSNPQVMVAAGLLARNAVARGLRVPPWVKTSLAPGSKVVTEYLKVARLDAPLDALGFNLVGYGCTTCIGNSGPLLDGVAGAVDEGDLSVAAVLSGNRNFEGRIHPKVRLNYLASPPLVVAYALAGTVDIDLTAEPIGTGADGQPVHLADIWPTPAEVAATMREALRPGMFATTYSSAFTGDERWESLAAPEGTTFGWDGSSTYIRRPPFFEDLPHEPVPVQPIRNAQVLALLGDSVTTDHISPAGNIPVDGPAGRYLVGHGVRREDFNSFGARRGNHEVMMRGTFANVRLRNKLAPGTEGGMTRLLPDGGEETIFDAAEEYRRRGIPLVVLAGKEYGTGSSRDWAAKGTALLGVRAVIAESFERIHRSNLIGMGVLPLQLADGTTIAGLGLTGEEEIDIDGIEDLSAGKIPAEVTVRAGDRTFRVRPRVDTPKEAEYFRHGGILPYMLRQLRAGASSR